MFEFAFRNDPLSRTEGLKYRYTILEKGGSRDPIDMLTEFLRRSPDSAAFNMELLPTPEASSQV